MGEARTPPRPAIILYEGREQKNTKPVLFRTNKVFLLPSCTTTVTNKITFLAYTRYITEDFSLLQVLQVAAAAAAVHHVIHII